MKAFSSAVIAALLAVSTTAIAFADAPYGAIATRGNSWGVATNQPSKERAERVSRHECDSVADGCTVRLWFSGHGTCGAVVRRHGQIGWGYASSRRRAIENAENAIGGDAELVKVACNS